MSNVGIKFIKKALGATAAASAATNGAIVFDTTSKRIFVDRQQYGSNLADATYTNNVLTITKYDNSTVELDFSGLATAASVMQAFNDVAAELDAIETGAGLNANGTYTAPTGTNYLGSATSLKNADTLLDAAIKAVDTKVNNINGAVQAIEFNNTSIAEDSDHIVDIAVDGTYNASTNKIATESTVSDAIEALDVSNITGFGAGKTLATLTETDGKITATFQDIAIDGNKVTSLNNYDSSSATGNVAATDNLVTALEKIEKKADSAISAAGVTSFGGESGDITLGSYLTMGTGTDNHQVSVTNVDTAGTSTTDTDLATVKTVTAHIGALDTSSDVQAVDYTAATGSNGAKLTFKGVSQTDGAIGQGSGSTELQLSKVATTGAAADVSIADAGSIITATTVEGALQEIAAEIDGMDGSHDVATASAITNPTAGEAAYKLELFDATETDGKIATNNSASETLYFTQAYSSSNPILTKNDIGSLSGAMHFKGTVDGTSTTLPTSNVTAGDVYVVSVAGTYEGQDCEVGDMIIAKDSTPTWTVVTGENQVTPVQGGAELVAGAAATTIGTVDGVSLTAKTTVTAGNATIASLSGNTVTLKSGVTQGTGTGTIANSTGSDITLADIAKTGAAANVSIADTDNIITATDVEGALQEIATEIDNMDAIVDADTTTAATGYVVPTLDTPTADFKVLNSVTEADGKLTAATAYNIKKVAATGAAEDVSYSNTINGTSVTNVDDALDALNTAITNSNITIDSQVGAITTGNGITTLTSNSKVIALDLDSNNANGLSVGNSGLAMAKASDSVFGTVQVTNGNGLSISSGVITMSAADSNGYGAMSSSDFIKLGGIETGAQVNDLEGVQINGTDLTIGANKKVNIVTNTAYDASTNKIATMSDVSAKTATVVDGSETVVVNDANATQIATVDGTPINTKVAFYWEEYA